MVFSLLTEPATVFSPSTELWNDVYGNFILQKLLEFGTDEMKESVAQRLASDSLSLSTRVYGW